MKVVRQITYECDSQEVMDRQIGRSLPDGHREGIMTLKYGMGCSITVRTLIDERIPEPPVPICSICNSSGLKTIVETKDSWCPLHVMMGRALLKAIDIVYDDIKGGK